MSLFENFTEDLLEKAAIEILEELGYGYVFGPDIAYDGDTPERFNYKDVILEQRVKDALFTINRHLPEEALEEAYRKIITFNSPILVDNNKDFHKLLVEGIDVSFSKNGAIKTEKAYIIDFNNINKNDFLVVNQFTVVERKKEDQILLYLLMAFLW